MSNSFIELQTGLKGTKLLKALNSGTSLRISSNAPGLQSEQVPILGVPHKIAYFTYRKPGEPTTEVLPVDLGMEGISALAMNYLTAGGGVPERISLLASIESNLKVFPTVQHLFAASVLWFLNRGKSIK